MEPTSPPKTITQGPTQAPGEMGQNHPNHTIEHLLAWARILRVGNDLNIAEDSLESIESGLLKALGMETAPPVTHNLATPVEPPRVPQGTLQPIPTIEPWIQAEKALEQKLRHLIQASAPWESLKPILLKLIQITESPQMAARCCEVALIHSASQHPTERDITNEIYSEIITTAASKHRTFYLYIHQALRTRVVLQHLRGHQSKVIDHILMDLKDHEKITPLESLALFLHLTESQDTASAFMHFQKHSEPMLQCAKTFQDQTGIPHTQILLMGGKLALKLGYISESRDILTLIDEPGADYETALRLLLDHRFLQPSNEPTYLDQINSSPTVDARLECLQKFFENTRRLGGFQDRHRPELNELLMTPFTWLGGDADSWAKASKLLVANNDLESLLPNLYQIFRENALRFHQADLDRALWEGPRQCVSSTPRDRYWRGVSLFHYYLVEGPQEENFLWESKALIEESRKDWHHSHRMLPGSNLINLPYEWKELHKYGYSFTTKNTSLLELDRSRMLVQLRICQHDQIVTTHDIESYLAQPYFPRSSKTSPEILTRLLGLVSQHPKLEFQILLRRAAVTHLTNHDIDRIWHLGLKSMDSDLSWRCASIIKSRGYLAKQVQYAWNISGEKRSHYPIMLPTRPMALAAIKDFPPPTHRFLHALLLVGPLLPELLQILDSKSTAHRPKSFPSGSLEHKMRLMLSKIPWLPIPKKIYIYCDGRSNMDQLTPPFAKLLPANPWSNVLNYICESLGIYAWNWSLKNLGSRMSLLVTNIAHRQGLQKQPLQVTKWLRALTPEQRTAWQDLSSLSRTIPDSECSEALSLSVCRWATMILQNHSQALESLMQMKAPAAMIWDLEQFILSEVYGEVRSIMKTRSKIMIPSVLHQLRSIVSTRS